MAEIYNQVGQRTSQVDDELLKDFFDEVLIEEKDLVEVDPGYLPDRGY